MVEGTPDARESAANKRWEGLMNRTISTAGLVALALAIGCGSSVPTTRVASAEAAVQTARASGANDVPEASKQLKVAEQELAKAKSLNEDKDRDEAEAMFSRAEADAALAASLANEANKKAVIESPRGAGTMQPQPPPGQ